MRGSAATSWRRFIGRGRVGQPVTSTRGALPGATGGIRPTDRDTRSGAVGCFAAWWGRCAHPSRRRGWSTPRDTTNEGRLKGVALAFREPARGRQWNQCCQGKEFLASCPKTRTAAPSTACPSPSRRCTWRTARVDPEHVTQLRRGSSSIPVQHRQTGCNHLPRKYLLQSGLDLTEPACIVVCLHIAPIHYTVPVYEN